MSSGVYLSKPEWSRKLRGFSDEENKIANDTLISR